MFTLIRAAADNNEVLDKEQLIAKFCLELASSRKTAVEILKGFEATEKIKIIGNEIWNPAQYVLELNANHKPKQNEN